MERLAGTEIFRELLDPVADPVMVFDADDGTVLEANRGACTVYGLAHEHLVGARIDDLVRVEEPAGQTLVEAAASSASAEVRSTRRMEDDRVTHLEHHTAQVSWQGRPAVVTVDRDVTGREHTEARLRQREFQLRVLSELTSDCCWARIEYPDGRSSREWISGSFTRLTGYSPEEFERLGRERLVHPDDLEEALQKVTGPPGISELEFRIITKSGEIRWLHERMHVLDSDDGVLRVFGSTRDVTERKRAEQAMLCSQEERHQSRRLEALGRLAGGVAHDFNNLLLVMLGHSDLLQHYSASDARILRCAQEIKAAAERASALTRKLLAFGRKQSLRPKVVELNELVRGTTSMLERLLPENIELCLELTEGLAAVQVDANQIEQVIINLVVNARDAVRDGGRVTISTRQTLIGELEAARRVGARPGQHVVLGVSDNGCGMAEEVQERVFEPFFTTKGEGTGLGLAAVYGTVVQSGGFITVDSAPDAGSRFEVFLPASPRPARVRRERLAAVMPTGSETILVVEDESVVRELVVTILENLGYQVLQAAGPVEALRRAEAHPETIHLLLTDVVMPEMDGRKLAVVLREQRPGLKVLLMSGYAQESLPAWDDTAVKEAFLAKPFAPKALARKVREVIEADSAAGSQA